MVKIDNKLTLEELDKVAGGNFDETLSDGKELLSRGLWNEKRPAGYTKIDRIAEKWAPEIASILSQHGYKYVAKRGVSGSYTGYDHPNEYYNREGKQVSRAEFWSNFSLH